MDPDIENQLSQLEALLFIHGEPLPLSKIAAVTGIEEGALPALLDAYRLRLQEPGRGIMLLQIGNRVQLATKPEFGSLLEQFVKSELAENLSPASLETLALIAYFGPMTRARIEYHRGVNSSFILRTLLLRGLIDRIADPASPSSYQYLPSAELFQHLGLAAADDLPEYESFRVLLQKAETAPSEKAPGETSSAA